MNATIADPAVVVSEKVRFEKLDTFIRFLGIQSGELKRKGDLIVILHQAQRIFGYLSVDVQEYIAEKLKVDIHEILSIVHFYEYFITEPRVSHSEVVSI